MTWRIDWSRDWWRHVTYKGQDRDPDMFGTHYLENGVGNDRHLRNQLVTWHQYVGPIIHVELWLPVTLKIKVIQIYSHRNISWVYQMALDRLRVLLNIILFCVQSVSECQLQMRFHDSIGAFLDCLPDRAQGLRHSQCSRWYIQNAVCHWPVADQSYPLLGFSLTECRYFHILSTCYKPLWQTLGLKEELMCK